MDSFSWLIDFLPESPRFVQGLFSLHNKHGETALSKKKPTMKKYCYIIAVAALFAACVGGQNNSSNAVKDFARAKVTEYYNCDADKVDVEKCDYSFVAPNDLNFAEMRINEARADYLERKITKQQYDAKVSEQMEKCKTCLTSWKCGQHREECRATESRTMYKCDVVTDNSKRLLFFVLCDKDETPLYSTMDVEAKYQHITALVDSFGR